MPRVTFQPLPPDRWPDLGRLVGARGACAACWCMWWRVSKADFDAGRGATNKRRFKKVVTDGPAPPGILAYADDEPVGWCAIAPRSEYPRFERARTLKPIDDRPVWSVTCFFIARPFRRQGLSAKLLDAAVRLAREHGAQHVEGYPVVARKGALPDAFAWTGLPSAFERAGFKGGRPPRAVYPRQLREIDRDAYFAMKRSEYLFATTEGSVAAGTARRSLH